MGTINGDMGGTVGTPTSGPGSGSVTAVSVVAANNITGTVANSTTTPALTLAVGGIPINSQSAAYQLILADAGKAILHPTADNNARTFTIPANVTVAFPIGTVITFINQIGTLSIAITTDTMTLYPAGGTGTRTLAASNVATAVKVGATEWVISGTSGLT